MILNPKSEKIFRHILAPEPEVCNQPTISTPEEWQEKRRRLSATLRDLLGAPSQNAIPVPKFEVLEEFQEADYCRQLIAYEVEPGEEVRAYLLLPPAEKRLLKGQ